MKKFMLFVAAMVCGSMMLFAQDSRVVVSECNFTSSKGLDRILEWNDEWNGTTMYNVATSLQAETGAVYGIPTSMVKLQVKNGEYWEDISASAGYKLKEDTKYRFEMQLRIDGTEYRLPDLGSDLSVYVNGQMLEVVGDPENTYPNYSFVWINSGSFEVWSEEYAGLLGGMRYNVNREKKTASLLPLYDGESETEVFYEGNIVIPDKIEYKGEDYDVTVIMDAAFAGCKQPLTVTIPAKVNTIIGAAFAGATGLTKITCKGATPPTVINPDFVFDYMDLSKVTLDIPAGSEAAYKAADGWKLFYVKTIYLNADIWDTADPVFFVKAWGGTSAEANVKMTKVDGKLYKAEIPTDHNKAVFARMQTGATEVKWEKADGLWNKTCDLDIPGTGHDCFLITGWDNGACDDLFDGKKLSGGGWIDHDAVFYVTGDSAFVKDMAYYSDLKAWAPDAKKVTSTHFWCTLRSGVYYKMKITNGTWDNAKGYTALKNKSVLPGVKADSQDNICFRVSGENQEINIYLEDDGTITLTGEFPEGNMYYDGYYMLAEPYDLFAPDVIGAYLVENPMVPGEYMGAFGRSDYLKAGTKLMAVEVKDDEIKNWYPSTKNAYVLPAKFADTNLNLYFRPAGYSDWMTFHEGGFFYIELEEETGIESIQTSAVRSQKVIKDGQLFIIMDGKIFNAQGAEVK